MPKVIPWASISEPYRSKYKYFAMDEDYHLNKGCYMFYHLYFHDARRGSRLELDAQALQHHAAYIG